MRRVIGWMALFAAAAAAQTSGDATLARGFEQPAAGARPMMRWWWFGPAVAPAEIERELRAMKAGGIGGVEIQPVYPLALDDAERGIRNLPFLSDDFQKALRFAAAKARELGMRVDITLGSGWPYGGPHITPEFASGRLRMVRAKAAARLPLPALEAGESRIAAFLVNGEKFEPVSDVRDGALWLPGGAVGEVRFFIASRSGMQVKRPSVGAEGFVLDHYSRPAIEKHLKTVADRLMTAFDGKPPYAIFCDSLEVYGGDWTPALLDEFRKRRGYDLKPLLPALFSEMGAQTAGLRHDWGQTLTELAEENFYKPMHEWSARNKTLFRIQGYGLPPAAISSFALSDLPEGEGPHWKILRASRWAASASHILGKPVTSSETWTWLHSPSFRATPLDLKAEADLHFLQGINQLIGHGWPYTPPGVEYPGWRLYAAAVFNDHNPWYIAMPEIARYLQRISWLLRQGKPANDVAVYLSNADGWSHLAPARVNLMETQRDLIGPDVVGRIIEAGYNLDFFDDGLLDRVLQQYKVIVLPGVETMPAAAIEKLRDFAKRGGIVVPTRRLPNAAPGYRATGADHAKVRASAAAFAANLVKDENRELGAKLNSLLPADVAVSSGAADFGFVHRKVEGAEVYFVVNTGNRPMHADAAFRVAGLKPEWWDPMTGRRTGAAVLRHTAEATLVTLDLAPYESKVIVFGAQAAAPAAPGNRSVTIDLSTEWKVTFGEGRTETWEELKSWSDDPSTRFYSGSVSYQKSFEVAANLPRQRVMLDLGEGKPLDAPPLKNGMMAMLDAPVREAAVVYINGQRVGAVWCTPYALEVTGHLKPGQNQIRIEVGNTAMNYMAGHSLPDYRLLNLRYGVRFEPQDMDKVQVLPSGLLGPVRLIATGR